MTNRELLSKTSELVAKERELTLEVIRHLREINLRKAFVECGYSSLWDYVTHELKYSGGAAKRRIDAMFALGENPELEKQVADGTLSLSTVSLVQSYVRHHDVPKEERLGLFKQMTGKSTREVERLLEPNDGVELRLTLSSEIYEKFRELQGLLAHQARSAEELFEKLVELGLKELHPAREPRRGAAKSEVVGGAHSSSAPNSHETRNDSAISSATAERTRYIPAQVRREVWRKSRNRCTYLDPATGRACGSKRALQVDHIEPYEFGGSNEASNLRLLCRQHNLYRSVGGH